MRNILVFLIAFAVLGSCTQPTSTDGANTKTIVAVNSLWQVVKKQVVSRSADTESIVDYVANYNTGNIDDFLRLYEDGQVPDIRDAPPVSVYIVNPLTYAVNWSAENIPRISLVENADGWRADAHGQLLFIDHIPPKPVYPWEVTPYEWYSLYLVDSTGAIAYEDHCGYGPDETIIDTWLYTPLGNGGGGWTDANQYYSARLQNFQSEMWRYPGGQIIQHQLYTEPSYVN